MVATPIDQIVNTYLNVKDTAQRRNTFVLALHMRVNRRSGFSRWQSKLMCKMLAHNQLRRRERPAFCSAHVDTTSLVPVTYLIHLFHQRIWQFFNFQQKIIKLKFAPSCSHRRDISRRTACGWTGHTTSDATLRSRTHPQTLSKTVIQYS